MQREPVHGRRHGMLAHPVMDIGACEVAGLDHAVQLGERAVRAGEVGRAANQPGNDRHQLLKHLLRGLPRGKLRPFAGEVGLGSADRGHDCRLDRLVDGIGEACARRRIEALGALRPSLVSPPVPRAGRAPGGKDRLRHLERRMPPMEFLARALDLRLAERGAMGRGRARFARRAIADDGAAGNQRRPVGDPFGILDGERYRLGIVTVDAGRVPARRPEALDLVVRDRQAGRAVDGDMIVVEQHDEAAELEMAGERDGLLAQAFHEAAVTRHAIGVVADDLIAVSAIEQPLGESHADRVAEPLAEGAGRGLDAGGVAVFGMARRAGAELAEPLQLVQLHLRVAGEIEQCVEQHRAVAGGEHETVAVGPVGVGGIEFEEAREQHGSDVGHAHGHAGMAGIGLLHRVHGERSDGVGHVLVSRLR